MDHVNNVRCPSLVAGSTYGMKTWLKTPTFTEVKFVGFDSATRGSNVKPCKLNEMKPGDVYNFVGFTCTMKDECLVNSEGSRVTFFRIDTAEVPAVVEPVAEASESFVEAVQEEVVVLSKDEQRRLKDRLRKAASRKAAKEAKATA